MFYSKDDIYDHVLRTYIENDTELDSTFFDFDVNLDVLDILKVYKEIQSSINGDIVMCLSDVQKMHDPKHPIEILITGKEEPELDHYLRKRNFTGNMRDLLTAFGENEKEVGIYRLTNISTAGNNKIKGTYLPLIL